MRAARRAAAISVKLVASANALASFESVDKESLKIDDQSKPYPTIYQTVSN
jgi:hypothetical protein